MSYFTQDFLDFFRDLAQHNERDWYHANKDRYYASVKEPFEAFVADLLDQIMAVDSHIALTPKETIFRLARDTRFSADKTPYKTHASAVIAEGGRKSKMSLPGIYIQLSPEYAAIYSGIYQPDKDTLLRIREGIAAQAEAFEKLLQHPPFLEKFGGKIHGEKHKRLPKEFQEAAERQPLLFNKSFTYEVHLPAERILQEDFLDVVLDHYLAARPLNQFFTKAIKEGMS